MVSSQAPFAPGHLELVRKFVNTRDLEKGTDELLESSDWDAWCQSQELPTGSARDDRERLQGLREALRVGMLANHDRAAPPTPMLDALNAALAWSEACPVATSKGLDLQPAGDGASYVAGLLVRTVAQALTDGSWSRMKACGDDTCQWAFYDHSRSRSGHWCSMNICGNRNKQMRWRKRQAREPRSDG